MSFVRTFADAPAVSRAAARDVVELAGDAIVARGRFTVALSGGSTPRALYKLLAGAPTRPRGAWERIEFFWGDERPVPPDHPESNYGMTAAALLDPLGVPRARPLRAGDRVRMQRLRRAPGVPRGDRPRRAYSPAGLVGHAPDRRAR
jgi:6-phosphogluconolactonase/glucosamine-6-phosphate isomerase/deaminase